MIPPVSRASPILIFRTSSVSASTRRCAKWIARNTSGAAADDPGSFNLAGIKDEVVDALLEKAQEAESRDDLYATLRAIDRILRDRHYWVPQWSKASHTLAYWDKFGMPDTKPLLSRGVLDTWWVDPAKAKAD
jgi:microcin C transport system substrate-binding protein